MINPFSKKPDTSNQPGVLLEMFVIRDTKANYYNAPFYAKTWPEAERMFNILANDSSTTISKHPEDFDLFHVGQFDMDKGIVYPISTPTHVVKAVNLRKQNQPAETV